MTLIIYTIAIDLAHQLVLCKSVEEYRTAKKEGLRFESSHPGNS